MSSPRPTSRFESLCEGIIEAGWLLALAVVPLLVNIYSQRTYEPDKAALVRSLAVLILAVWLLKVAAGGRLVRPIRQASVGSAGRVEKRRWIRLIRVDPLLSLAVALGLLVVVGSALSIDARLSWLGSYARAQGAWTELAYLVVFAAVVSHLRTWVQWRRIVLVVVVAGTMVALYAIFQALGLDPVETVKSTRRVYSTLGNAIFLGAYLIMTFFVTAFECFKEVVESSGRDRSTAGERRSRILRASVLGLACLCQVVALVLSQSRGPFLGLVAGCYLVFLFGLMTLRERSTSRPAGSRARSLVRWTVPAILGMALLSLVLLIASNTSGTPLSWLSEVPYLGRLSSVLDPGSRTIQVRLLIWQGATELLSSDDAIVEPGGGADPHHRERRLVGYGPDTFGLAINRHIPPRLGQLESRLKTPDRAHNDTLDRMVMNGILGAILWLGIYTTLFSLALRSLGLVESRCDGVALWAVLGAGASVGAAAPWLVSGRPTLSGVGLQVGLAASLAVFVTARVMFKGVRQSQGRVDWRVQGIALALMATVVAHVVEIHVGIAITSTRLYFWVLAAVLLIVARGWLEVEGTPPLQGERRRQDSADAHSRPAALVPVLLALGLCLPWIHSLTLGGRDARILGSILDRSWWGGGPGSGGGGPPTVLFWVVAATLALSAVISRPIDRKGRARGRFRFVIAGAVVGTVGIYAAAQSARVAHSIPGRAGQAGITDAAEAAAGQYGELTWVVLLLAVAVGVAIGMSGAGEGGWFRRSPAVTAAAGLVLGTVAIVVIQRHNIDPIRADGLLKAANALASKGKTEQALELLDRSCEIAPNEPMQLLIQGRTALTAAVGADSDLTRAAMLDLAESSLERARKLAPLDPDHWANLGRYRATRAREESDPGVRRRHMEWAGENYAAALQLRPSSVVFLNEYGRLLLNMGGDEQAIQALERAVALDSLYTEPYLALAVLWERRAAAANRAGDQTRGARQLEEALAMYERALLVNQDLESARSHLERIENGLILQKRPLPSRARMLELFGSDAATHVAMASALLDRGRARRALRHAELAVELAEDDEQRQRAHELESQARSQLGSTPVHN